MTVSTGPMTTAVATCQVSTVKVLLSHGFTFDRFNPLQFAFSSQDATLRYTMLEYLFNEHGDEMNIFIAQKIYGFDPGSREVTLLYNAILRNDSKCTQLLINHGCGMISLTIHDFVMQKPISQQKQYRELLETLLPHIIDPSIDNYNDLALSLQTTLRCNYILVAQLIIKYHPKALTALVPSLGISALHFLASKQLPLATKQVITTIPQE